MKRFHVHLHVQELDKSIAFYTNLFGTQPARVEADYAKWMLEDPRLNFAISTRGNASGLDHFGMQVDDEQELSALKAQAQAADMSLLDEGNTNCCYANSTKHWVTDPQGIAWEHFHTLGSIPVYGKPVDQAVAANPVTPTANACCAPRTKTGTKTGTKASTATTGAVTQTTKASCC